LSKGGIYGLLKRDLTCFSAILKSSLVSCSKSENLGINERATIKSVL